MGILRRLLRGLLRRRSWTALLTECAITADLDEPDVAISKENAGLYCMHAEFGEGMVKNLPQYMICLLLSFNRRSFGTEGGPQ